MTTAEHEPLYFRQLLAGRDIALDNPFATSMRNYIYVIGDRSTMTAVIVDAAYAPGEVVDYANDDGFQVVGAIATHYHADHIGGQIAGHGISGLIDLLEIVDVPVHIQRDEREWITKALQVPSSSLIEHESNDVITFGTTTLTLVHTPGHTPGSQCVLVANTLVTGDTLFLNGCGRTDLPGGDPDALYDSLHRRLGAIPAETVVFPGHAYDPRPFASMRDLRETNAVLFDMAKTDWLRHFAG